MLDEADVTTEGAEPTVPEPEPLPPVVPHPDPRGFRRELTPTWLHAATLLGGHRPPDLSRPFRAAYLGCGNGQTPSVVAAVHPDCEIWAWDFRLNQVEATRRLRDEAGLDNLVVHERRGLPSDLGSDRLCDVIVVAGVLDVVDDEMREQVIAAVGSNLRPGGVLCVTYRTTVGWIEIVPVQRLMRYVAQRDTGDPEGVVDRVLDLLAELQEGGAGYIVHRPVVAAWLAEEVFGGDPAAISQEYLEDDMRPISHAQLVDWLEPFGLAYVGSARLTDDLDLDLKEELKEMIDRAPSPLVREAYRDIAVRRACRADAFRMGEARLSQNEQANLLGVLDVVDGELTARDVASIRSAFEAGPSHPASVTKAQDRVQGDAVTAVFLPGTGLHLSTSRGSASTHR